MFQGFEQTFALAYFSLTAESAWFYFNFHVCSLFEDMLCTQKGTFHMSTSCGHKCCSEAASLIRTKYCAKSGHDSEKAITTILIHRQMNIPYHTMQRLIPRRQRQKGRLRLCYGINWKARVQLLFFIPTHQYTQADVFMQRSASW